MRPALHLIRLAVLATATALAGLAQTAPEPIAGGIAELFAGELDDVGPQFLLQDTTPASQYVTWIDAEFAGTDNATYAAAPRRSSTLFTAQAGAVWRGLARPLLGGTASLEAGLKLQSYRYGLLDGHGRRIDFVELRRNDFHAIAPHLQALWLRGPWSAAVASRGTELRSVYGNRPFYREAVLDAQLYRRANPRPSLALAVGVEAARRWTRTDSYGILPNSWNDRAEFALVGVAEQRLGREWRLQPVARLQYATYSRTDRARHDWQGSARLSLLRTWRSRWEGRVFVAYERRTSTELLIADYSKWDGGLGGSAHWQF